MKPTQVTELLANIKATIVSFFSILMFVALGVGIFVGIYWMTPAMEKMADGEYEKGNFHHFQIQFPYGLTDEDIAALEQVEGVDAVEPARQTFATMKKEGKERTVKLQSLPENIDTLCLVDGVLPTKPNELVAHVGTAQDQEVQVGDTLDLGAGGGNEQLRTTVYKVVGLASSSEYLALNPQSLGYSTSGSGSINLVAWAPLESFNAEAFYDAWPVVNVRCSDLKALNSFHDEYKNASAEVEQRIVSLGETLGDERFDSLHSDANQKLADGEAQLEDAKSEIAAGEKKLEQGKKEISEAETQVKRAQEKLKRARAQAAYGEKKLKEARETYDTEVAAAKKKLSAAKKKLDEGQKQYDEAAAALKQAKKANDELQEKYAAAKKKVTEAESALENLEGVQKRNKKMLDEGEITEKEYWEKVQPLYMAFKRLYDKARVLISELNEAIKEAQAAYPDVDISGKIPTLPEIPALPESVGTKIFSTAKAKLASAIKTARKALDKARNATITVEDQDISYETASMIAPVASKEIKKAEKELAAKKKQLDAGKKQYAEAKEQFDKKNEASLQKLREAEADLKAGKEKIAAGEQEIKEGQAKIAAGKEQIAKKTKELEKAKTELAEKTKELEEFKQKVGLMKNYGWSVASRAYNGGHVEAATIAAVPNRLSYTMAALFVIVGILVSYSAVSRIVHEQITQVGTKKALGLRSREITLSFLLYAALAVIVGSIIGLIVGTFVVEGIIGNAMGARFYTRSVPPYFSMSLALLATGIELVLVLGSTWFACHSILRMHAVELLRGEQPPSGKTRFFEKWKMWDKLPLYTQTIVNNCLNDKRRVFSTVVGVAGCTALVVTAITLNNDVLLSYDIHYENVYDYNAITYVNSDVEDAVDEAEGALEKAGYPSTAVLRRNQALQLASGDRVAFKIVVPADLETFAERYHINSTSGGSVDLAADEVWVSQAYASHYGAKPGDEVTINGADGAIYKFAITGFYEYYLTHNEMVMSPTAYKRIYGAAAKPNVVLSQVGDASFDDIDAMLSGIEGYDSIADDAKAQKSSFRSFSNVSRTVVLVYLALSILMAIVVLLNLNVMFIEEKKRELIVLMINGFSTKDAKRYVYNDTIVLTVIGIVLGLLLGIAMGSMTVAAVEPETAWFFKGVNTTALLIGAGVSAVLSVVMSVIALRRVPRFKLTDINRV